MKTVFLVLGAQRSGTSVTSHVLSRFGIDFGKAEHFLQDNHNPIFFELRWVNHLNNELINALGYHYTDLFLPLEKDFAAIDTQEIEERLKRFIEKEWDEKPLVGIKDPRLSLTFPVWEKVLSKTYKIRVIFVFRNPSGFLQSNKKLFFNWEGWTDERHMNFWLQLNLSAIYLTRHDQVYYLNYDCLMANPLNEVEAMARFLELDHRLVADAAAVVNRFYYHYEEASETGFPRVDRCYRLLCLRTLAQQPT